MTLAAVLLILVLLICMLLGIPVAWSLIIASLSAIIADGGVPLAVMAQRLFTGADSFAMLAIPAFIVAGEIMSQGGISKRLIDFANALVGSICGALSLVTIVACTFFAAISGSATATTAAIGGMMYPEMVKRGYPKDYATAVQAIGGTLGPVIPPSAVAIFYANATGASAASLLIAGIIPGIISCGCLCFVAYLIAKKRKFPKDNYFSLKLVVKEFRSALLGLLMPVIILGGIYSGIFTPTESAIIAVVYGLIVSVFIYRELDLRGIWNVLKNAVKSTANLMILVISAQLFGWLVAYFNIPGMAADALMGFAANKYIFLLLITLLLLVAGMFMEATAIVVIMAPILHPLALQFGLNPIHFGLVVVFLLSLGIATPPFGPSLFVACSISKEPVTKVSRQIMPFIGIQIVLALVLCYVPILSTWLPGLMK